MLNGLTVKRAVTIVTVSNAENAKGHECSKKQQAMRRVATLSKTHYAGPNPALHNPLRTFMVRTFFQCKMPVETKHRRMQ
jgi:hypothetical protein